MIRNEFKEVNLNQLTIEDMLYVFQHHAYSILMNYAMPNENQRKTTYNLSYLMFKYETDKKLEKLEALNKIINKYVGVIEAYTYEKHNSKKQKVQIGYTIYPSLPDYLDYYINKLAMEMKLEDLITKETKEIQNSVKVLEKDN